MCHRWIFIQSFAPSWRLLGHGCQLSVNILAAWCTVSYWIIKLWVPYANALQSPDKEGLKWSKMSEVLVEVVDRSPFWWRMSIYFDPLETAAPRPRYYRFGSLIRSANAKSCWPSIEVLRRTSSSDWIKKTLWPLRLLFFKIFSLHLQRNISLPLFEEITSTRSHRTYGDLDWFASLYWTGLDTSTQSSHPLSHSKNCLLTLHGMHM